LSPEEEANLGHAGKEDFPSSWEGYPKPWEGKSKLAGRRIKEGGRKSQIVFFRELCLFKGLRRLLADRTFSSLLSLIKDLLIA
jgi:hypothetical protein